MEGTSVAPFGKILSKEDFDKICRCCFSQDRLDSIFQVLYEKTKLVDILYSLFGTQVDLKDDLPKQLCETCIGQIIRFYSFKKRYEATETALRNIMAVKVEDVELEIKTEPLRCSIKEEDTQLDQEMITDSKENETCSLVEEQVVKDEHEDMELYTEKKFLCNECGKEFPTKKSLRTHSLFHTEAAEVDAKNLLPMKSRAKYEQVYKDFMDWRNFKKVDSFSENVLLEYFGELSSKYKSSSLWSRYSMLRSTLTVNNSINIENYSKLRAFLKRKSAGYHARRAKAFTPDQINKFINEAPDHTFLATKVALIMGITGACGGGELYTMNIRDVQDLGSTLLVTIPNSKAKVKKFTIGGHFYQICKKYLNLRPTNLICESSFFLNYQNGKCTPQKVGINKFSAMGKQIATFLKLPHLELYSGHSFRRSSATTFMDAGGWKSITLSEGSTDDQFTNTQILK